LRAAKVGEIEQELKLGIDEKAEEAVLIAYGSKARELGEAGAGDSQELRRARLPKDQKPSTGPSEPTRIASASEI
jgi:hypothetical protein